METEALMALLPELTKQHAKPTQGAQCKNPKGLPEGALLERHEQSNTSTIPIEKWWMLGWWQQACQQQQLVQL